MTGVWVACVASAVLAGPPGEVARVPTGPEIRLSQCLVSMIHDVTVAAEEAGVVVAIEAKEGRVVEAQTFLARINDSQAQAQKRVALAEKLISDEKASNDIEVRYSTAAAKVAEYEFLVNWEANQRVPGTKPETELQRLKLAERRAELQIEQAEHLLKISGLETQAKQAQVELADDDIRRRTISAPISGEVVKVFPEVGEWVKAGDPVARIVRLDKLRIECLLRAAEYAPQEVAGRPVRVDVRLERGRTEAFEGKIVFVDPLVDQGGEYKVWAEVENRQQDGYWLLRPGLLADVTIFTTLSEAPPLAR